MQPIELEPMEGARKIVYAANQPEYHALPALLFREGSVLTRWQLTPEERAAIAAGACVDLWVWPYGQPLQPLLPQVEGLGDA